VQVATSSSFYGSVQNRGQGSSCQRLWPTAAPTTGTARTSARWGKRKRRGRGLRGGAHLGQGRTGRWPPAVNLGGRWRWYSGTTPVTENSSGGADRRVDAHGGVVFLRRMGTAANRRGSPPADIGRPAVRAAAQGDSGWRSRAAR
jgi:hypothetical protein